ncbi:MAG: MATE family efflux transporter [Defluviitaleaceae bacterium]|nr:MATE family efflux transporter [Defluviitaleaceae bacterium]
MEQLSKGQIIKETVRIAGPVMMESLMASTVMMINTAMVGRLDNPYAVAIVGVNAAPSWMLNSIPMGLCVGATVMVARSIGAGDKEKANKYARQTVGGIFLLASVLSIAMFFLSQVVPVWVNADEMIRTDASLYLRILSLSIVPNFIGFACSGMLRGSGNTKTPMLAGLMTNIITMSLNFFLLYDFHEMTIFGRDISIQGAGLGVHGAAVSTAVAQLCFGIFMISRVIGKKQKIRVDLRRVLKFDWETLRPMLKVGIPAMGERLTISFGQVMYATTINGIGPIQTAAHSLAVQIESLAFMPANALSVSATTLVGQSLGAKNIKNANAYAKTVLAFAAGVGVLCFFAFWFAPAPLIGLLSNNTYIIAEGAAALRVMAPVEPLFCMLIVINGILRGGGDTHFALYAGIAGMWGVRLAAAWYAVNILGWGLVGAWVGMALDIVVRFTIMFIRYMRKKWLNVDAI